MHAQWLNRLTLLSYGFSYGYGSTGAHTAGREQATATSVRALASCTAYPIHAHTYRNDCLHTDKHRTPCICLNVL